MSYSVGILDVPDEIIQEIALQAVLFDFLGPPACLLRLMLTCRRLHDILSTDLSFNTSFYQQLFEFKFNTYSLRRRLPPASLTAPNFAMEFRKRWQTLGRIRCGLVSKLHLPEDLIRVILLVIEADEKNLPQLFEWARLEEFCMNLSNHIFTDIMPEKDDSLQALATMVVWLCINRRRMINESMELTRNSERILRYCSLAASKFKAYFIDDPAWQPALHSDGEYERHIPVTYFGIDILFQPTPISLSSIAIVFGLDEQQSATRSPYHSTNAIGARESHYVTLSRPMVKSSTESLKNDSAVLDCSWYRMVVPIPPLHSVDHTPRAFAYGNFEGSWQGRMLIPQRDQYEALVQGTTDKLPFTFMTPLTGTFREYYREIKAPQGSTGIIAEGGLLNGWLPPDCSLHEEEGMLRILDPRSSGTAVYQSLQYLRLNTNAALIPWITHDIIIVGEARCNWAEFVFEGRVRQQDGAIVLLRTPRNTEDTALGRSVFRGYIHGAAVLVGRWRETFTPLESPGTEGPFVLYKS